MVPAQAFPSRAGDGQPSHSGPDGADYTDTGFACRPGRDAQTLIITAAPSGTINVAGYCFSQSQIDALVARADPDATIVALPDGDLGHRLAGTAPDRAALQAGLLAHGFNPLLLGAFRRRGAHEVA
jgi:hypothetical protein